MFGILLANFLKVRVENYASPNPHFTASVALTVNEQNWDYDIGPFLLLDMLDVFIVETHREGKTVSKPSNYNTLRRNAAKSSVVDPDPS